MASPIRLLAFPLLAALALASPQTAVDAALDTGLYAAAAGEDRVTWDELDRALLEKHGGSDAGREATKHLLRVRVLERLARESRLEITDEEVEERLESLAEELRAAGEAPDLETYLRRNNVAPDTFRELLRLGLVQERLARRALGIPESRPITGELQEMWLDDVLVDRGVEYPPAPWTGGVVARCGDLSVTLAELREHLRTSLNEEDLRDACRHILLVRRMRARMPDLTEAAVAEAVATELERRRSAIRANPTYQGLGYDELMRARGTLPGALERDPEIVATALAWLWVDRKHDEAGLRELYAEERAFFDGRFGEALEARILFLNAAVLTNVLNPRTFAEARAELERLRPQLVSSEAFVDAVARWTEDPRTKAEAGRWGWVTRGGEAPPAVVAALFSAHPDGLDPEERLVGPIDLQGGVAFLWVEQYRPTPDWTTMRRWVHRELRRRFVADLLPAEGWVTYLDVP